MRRAVFVGSVLIALAVISAEFASGCGYTWGRCGVPCGYTSCCVPRCYVPSCCVPVYCCVPVVCQPICCEPATQVAPSQQAPAPQQLKPTLAPPEPRAESTTPVPPQAKSPVAPPAEQPKAEAPAAVELPVELPVPPASSEASKAAEGRPVPSKAPAAPAGPEAKPVERPLSPASEKPLVAQYDNPFILETDQLQIWTDSTGNFRVEARFVSFNQHTVRLQRPGGQYLRVEYDRLSMADRERARDLSLAVAMKTSMK